MSSRKTISKILAIIVILTVVLMLFVQALLPVLAAPPPNILSYQGRLLTTAGAPVTASSASMIFRFYSDVSGGTCLWSNSSISCASATAMTVTLTDGLFSVNLGDTSASFAAIGDSVFADDDSVFLDVTVNSESLLPRRQIVAAPYAMNAGNIDGFNSSQSGGTSPFVPVTNTNGNLTLTGNPQSTAVGGGSLYVNPASADADEVLFGIGLAGSSRFAVDEDGDLSVVGDLFADNAFDIDVDDNIANAFTLSEGSTNYLSLTTTNSAETLMLGASTLTQMTFTTDNDDAGNVVITGGLTLISGATHNSVTVTSSVDTENAVAVTANSSTIGDILNLTGTMTTGSAIDITDSTGDTGGADGHVFIKNTDPTLTAQQYMIQGRYSDDGDVNGDFLLFEDNTNDDKFVIAEEGFMILTPGAAGDSINITNGVNGDWQALVVNATTADSTQTAGIIDLNVDSSTNTAVGGLYLTFTAVDDDSADTLYGNRIDIVIQEDTTATDAVYGEYIDITNSDSNATGIGLWIANNDNSAGVVNSGIIIENLQSTDVDMTNGLLILATTNGSMPNAINVSDAEIDNALIIGANDIEGTTGSITFTGASTYNIADNTASAFTLQDETAGADYLAITTTNNSETMILGHSTVDSITFTTDNDSDSDYSFAGGATFSDDVVISSGVGEVFEVTRSLTNATAENGMTVTIVALDTTSATLAQYGVVIDNAASSEALDGSLVLQNSDADDTVAAGLLFAAGGAGTDFNYGIDFDAANIGSADIRFENSGTLDEGSAGTWTFDRSSSGTVTLAATDDDTDTALTISSGGSGILTLDGSTGNAVNLGASDNFGILAASTTVDGTTIDSPTITLRGTYDSDSGAGVTSSNFDAVIFHDLLGTVPGSMLVFDIGGGSDEMILTESGNLQILGSFNAGDSTGTDTFNFTSATTVVDAMSLTADSVTTVDAFEISADGLTLGSGLNITRADSAVDFDSTTGLLSVTVANDNASSDGRALVVTNRAGGQAVGIYVVQSGVNVPAANTVSQQAMVIDVNEAVADDPGGDEDVLIIRSDADGTPDTEFKVQLDGDIAYDGTASSPASDLAEVYPSNEVLEAGDVVVLDTEDSGKVKKATSSYAQYLFGAISTKPAVRMGSDFVGYDVTLAGRISLKVSAENGAIAVGDALTSSTTAGYAMKATEPGMILGYALESHLRGLGTIDAFVDTEWSAGSVLETDGSVSVLNDSFVFASLGEATSTTSFGSNLLTFRGSGWDGTRATVVAMTLGTAVTDGSSAIRLSVGNGDGVEVAYVSAEGDAAFAGRLYPSDRGLLQTSKYLYYDGSEGIGGDFIRTNASGWATGSYDFAEMFPSSEELVSGDVVIFAGTGEAVRRSASAYDTKLAGIVSTRPGFLAGENTSGQYPVALAGRVPTRVTNEAGAIAVGDPLTSSSLSGYAMKATRPGPIIGYALEASDATQHSILVFVRGGWYGGEATTTLPGTSNTASQVSSIATIENLDVVTTRRVDSATGMWSIAEDGTFRTRGLVTMIAQNDTGAEVELYATASSQVTVMLSGTATLQSGSATILFEEVDANFNDVISDTEPIRVLVTPNGPTSPLFVNHRERNGFTVSELGGTTNGVSFDWLVIAYREGYEPSLEGVEESWSQESKAVEVPVETPEEIAVEEQLFVEVTDEIVVEEEVVVEAEFIVDTTIEPTPLTVVE